MQMSVPEALDLAQRDDGDPAALRHRQPRRPRSTAAGCSPPAGWSSAGVRFMLVYLSDYGEWDSHTELKDLHARSCARVDKPIAGLLKDLKRRGLIDDVTVVCCTEFGRTPGLEMRDGTNAKPTAATTIRTASPSGSPAPASSGAWSTARPTSSASTPSSTPTTSPTSTPRVLHLLGLDPRRLDVPGRKRLEIDHGQPIRRDHGLSLKPRGGSAMFQIDGRPPRRLRRHHPPEGARSRRRRAASA